MLRIESPSKCAFLFIDLQPIFTDRFNDTVFQKQTEDAFAFARSVTSADKIIHLRANYEDTKMIAFSYILRAAYIYPCVFSVTSLKRAPLVLPSGLKFKTYMRSSNCQEEPVAHLNSEIFNIY